MLRKSVRYVNRAARFSNTFALVNLLIFDTEQFAPMTYLRTISYIYILYYYTCREMEEVLAQVASSAKGGKEDIMDLINTWYKKDENAIPPAYVLQPISSQFPEFITTNGENILFHIFMNYRQHVKNNKNLQCW